MATYAELNQQYGAQGAQLADQMSAYGAAMRRKRKQEEEAKLATLGDAQAGGIKLDTGPMELQIDPTLAAYFGGA